MPDAGDEYTIGRYRGGLAITFTDPATGRRRRFSLGTTDPTEARRRAPGFWAELTRPKCETVKDLWEAYRQHMTGRRTAENMVWSWKPLAERFGPMRADEITPADCDAHIAARKAAGIKDWTIFTELGHLRNVLTWAKKQKLIAEVPFIKRPPQPRPKEDKGFTQLEVRRMIKAADISHVQLALVLLYTTAARSAALRGLTWDRVDFAAGRIDLRDPTITRPHKGRAIVPILKTAEPYLREAQRDALTPYVLEWAGKPIKSLRRGLARAGQLAGIPRKVTPHLLRHTAAIHMAEDGVPMEVIAQFLGHANVDTTRKIYARFSPTFLRDAASALEL